jgi:ABC-2 type transport system permease protein
MYFSAILAIAYRDFTRFVRDRTRVISSLVFPAVFIGILGGSFQSGLGDIGFSFITFVFLGIMAQNMFSTTAQGLVSMVTDRDSNFTQELFVAPVPRFAIVFGKIVGETAAAFVQLFGIVLIAWILGADIYFDKLLLLVPAAVLVGALGGAFGVLIMANVRSQQAASQIFTFLFFPQFFLAGVFTPINNLSPILNILSHLAPLRYGVDLLRGIYYQGNPAYHQVVSLNPWTNVLIIVILFTVMLSAGSYLFARNERNR